MNFEGIKRRIEKLATAAGEEPPVACQAEQVVRHWRETGELSNPDGSRISVAVFRQITACALDGPDPAPHP